MTKANDADDAELGDLVPELVDAVDQPSDETAAGRGRLAHLAMVPAVRGFTRTV